MGIIYYNGSVDIRIKKDEDRAIKLLTEASDHDILKASILLLEIYVNRYNKSRNDNDYEEVMKYKKVIEKHPLYNDDVRDDVMKKIGSIKKYKKIDIDFD